MVVVVVVSVVVPVIVQMVMGHLRGIQSKGHGFNQSVQTETQKGQQAKTAAVNMSVLHAFAHVF
jgi:hypothetical protein